MNLPQITIGELPTSVSVNFSAKELADFISSKRILIVDEASHITQTLQRILGQLGARPTEIFVYRSFDAASQGILARRPQILVTSLHLDGGSGLDLVKAQERQYDNRLELASLVLVPDASSATAGMIADANVDAVLIKPLSTNGTREAFFQALANKVKPSPYWSTLEKGKQLLNRTELEEAMRLFEEAKQFDPKPTLSFYYQGLIEQQKKRYEHALDRFNGGLAFDPRDYRCLSATFDLRLERSEYEEAYSVVRTIHEHYPVNAKRLLDLVKLSISVGKFEDIPNYHQVFVNGENVDPQTARGVIAAMLVSAKSFAWKDERVKALEVLRSAGRLAMKHKVLREDTLRYFIETRHFEHGLAYYTDLPASLKEDMTLQMFSLESHHGLGNSTESIRTATQILKTGRAPARAYEIIIDHSKRLGRPETVISRLVAEAQEYYPSQKW